jgi:hypothetical protein
MKPPISQLHVSWLAALLAAGCASGTRVADAADAYVHTVIVNGAAVPTHGNDDLLDVLRRRFTYSALGAYAVRSDDEPMVLVDGLRYRSIRELADIPAFQVASVQRIRAAEAVLQYGSQARMGAIIVRTRTGPRLN